MIIQSVTFINVLYYLLYCANFFVPKLVNAILTSQIIEQTELAQLLIHVLMSQEMQKNDIVLYKMHKCVLLQECVFFNQSIVNQKNDLQQHHRKLSKQYLEFQTIVILRKIEIQQKVKLIAQVEKKLRDAQENTKLFQNQLQQKTKKLEALQKQFDSKQKQIEQFSLQKNQSTKILEEKQKQFNSLLDQSQKDKEKIKSLTKTIEQLKYIQLPPAKREIQSLQRKVAQIQQREASNKRDYQKLINSQSQEKKKAQTSLLQEQRKANDLTAQVKLSQSNSSNTNEVKQKNAQLLQKNQFLALKNTTLKEQNQSLQTYSNSAKKQLQQVNRILRQKELYAKNADKIALDLGRKLSSLENKAKQTYNNLMNDIEKEKQNVIKLQKQIGKLQHQNKVIQMTNQTKIYRNIVMQKGLNWKQNSELISKDSYALVDTFYKSFAAIKNKQQTSQSTYQKEAMMYQIRVINKSQQIKEILQ